MVLSGYPKRLGGKQRVRPSPGNDHFRFTDEILVNELLRHGISFGVGVQADGMAAHR